MLINFKGGRGKGGEWRKVAKVLSSVFNSLQRAMPARYWENFGIIVKLPLLSSVNFGLWSRRLPLPERYNFVESQEDEVIDDVAKETVAKFTKDDVGKGFDAGRCKKGI